MFNEKQSPAYIKKLRRQRFFLLGLSGLIGCGIIAEYLNFHNQVAKYTQSVAYREIQEAKKDYTAELMKRNQRLFTTDHRDPTSQKKTNKQ